MKKTFILTLAAAMFATLHAQSVKETTAQYKDYTIPAYTVTVKQEKDLVSDAVQQRLKDAGLKTSKSSGHITAENQTFTEIYSQPIDFYAKVDEEGRRSNRVTVVTFFAKSPNLSISQNELNLNVRRFAESFPTYANRYEAQQKVNAEAKNLEKAQKTQSKAASSLASIEKDIASDQEKITKKEAEIAKLQQKIESLQNDITKLNANIEKNNQKKTEAETKLNQANQDVQNVESELNRHRQQVGNQ
ncbi:MAG: hypothetical protein IJP80_01420 [Bacteroidales bacterium]|nr:hypothetical protein [Bacteroidales bacterium]